jgi:hypothetical protein
MSATLNLQLISNNTKGMTGNVYIKEEGFLYLYVGPRLHAELQDYPNKQTKYVIINPTVK